VKQSTDARPARKRSSAKRPDVIVDFIFEEGLLYIVVENIGDEPALKVSVRFKPKFKGVGGQVAVSTLPLFENIEFLAPHKSIRTFLDASAAYFQRNEPLRITARVSYNDRQDRHYQELIHHDLSIYQDIGYIQRTSKSVSPHLDS
jgi:hypothetical protein